MVEANNHLLLDHFSEYKNGNPIGRRKKSKYFHSKFDRNIGDLITMDNKTWIVAFVGHSEDEVWSYARKRIKR